jgi:hypothetical protein
MPEKVSLLRKSFYVIDSTGLYKRTFHIYEEQCGKKIAEENTYCLKKDKLEFSEKPIQSLVREVGDDFLKHAFSINFGNFYINGGDSISVSVFLQCICLNVKNEKLKKQIMEICNTKEFKEMQPCIPRDVVTFNFDVSCE